MGNTDAATAEAEMQLVQPDQRLELRVTLTLMETLSPEWSITGQDHNIWSKMPLGEWHLQQLSFSLMLTPGSRDAAWPELPCSLRSPDSCKIPVALSRVRLYSVFSPPSYNITNLSTRSLLSMEPQGKAGDTYTPLHGLGNVVWTDSARREGITEPLLLLLCSLPITLNI